MKVTVFVPIQLTIKGDNKVDEVLYQLKVMSDIVNSSELESNPVFNIELVGDSEIIEDIEE